MSEWKSLSRVRLCAAPRTIQSREFSRPEYWSGWSFRPLGDLSNPGIKPRTPTLQVDSLSAEPQGKPKNTGAGSYPFASGSSWPRNWTKVSCIAGGFFISWATREVPSFAYVLLYRSVSSSHSYLFPGLEGNELSICFRYVIETAYHVKVPGLL